MKQKGENMSQLKVHVALNVNDMDESVTEPRRGVALKAERVILHCLFSQSNQRAFTA
jgi:hypothetical protein